MFENPEIEPDALPTVDTVDWQPLNPRYVRQQQVMRGIFLGSIAAIWIVLAIVPFPISPPWFAMWTSLILLAAMLLTWPVISYPRLGYAIREHDIIYKAGVFWQSVTAIPFNRVQHVETSHSPLDRQFGSGTLQLFTAGGSGGDLQIAGLERDTAEQLRVFILKKAGAVVEEG